MPQAATITVPVTVGDAVGDRVALSDVESGIVRGSIAYWQGLCRGRPFPMRADVLPRDIRSLLRNIALVKVVDGGADYEYRVIGDAHVIAYGYSAQGKLLSETDDYAPGHATILKRLYDRVVRKHEPYAIRGWIARSEKQKKYIYSESFFAPLGDGDVVDHIFNVSVYVPKEI